MAWNRRNRGSISKNTVFFQNSSLTELQLLELNHEWIVDSPCHFSFKLCMCGVKFFLDKNIPLKPQIQCFARSIYTLKSILLS